MAWPQCQCNVKTENMTFIPFLLLVDKFIIELEIIAKYHQNIRLTFNFPARTYHLYWGQTNHYVLQS